MLSRTSVSWPRRTTCMPCWPKSGGLANATSVEVEGSVVVRWAILQTSATQTPLRAWVQGGHPSPQRRRTHASTDGGRPRELTTSAVDRGPPPSGFASPTRSPDRGARLSRAASKPKRQNTRCCRSDPSHRSAMNWPSPRHARLASEPAGLLPAPLSALARR